MSRFLLYSHDTYGLGHFRRSSLLAAALVGAAPDHEVLIVTGSPRAQAFRLPDRVDTVKLPSATKGPGGSYRPRKLTGSLGRLVELRSRLITAAAESFEPDVVLVDHAPAGMQGELLPALQLMRRTSEPPRVVLGLRDIIDAPDRVEAAWQRDGIWQALEYYDDILVYGDERIGTTATDIGLQRRSGLPVTHTGYVAPVMPDPTAGDPYVLVTPGGGGDGHALTRRFLDAAEQGAVPNFRSLVVTGPLLSAGRRAEILTRSESLPTVDVIEFSDRMRSLIASAAGVVSMAGYNTVVEELAAGVPALLVPRCRPRLEQHVRATRLAPFTALQHVNVSDLTTDRIGDFVTGLATEAKPQPADVDLGGVAAAARQLTRPISTATKEHSRA